jgi:hypothetical protein
MDENSLSSDLASLNMAYLFTSAQPNLKSATQFLSTDATHNILMAPSFTRTTIGLEMDISLREATSSNWIF